MLVWHYVPFYLKRDSTFKYGRAGEFLLRLRLRNVEYCPPMKDASLTTCITWI